LGKGGRRMSRRLFKDEAEEQQWLWAVEECRPFRKTDSFLRHLERIAEKAGRSVTQPVAKAMPDVRLPYKESA
jgi:hypothetical protein